MGGVFVGRRWIAEYECLRCRHHWSEMAGPTVCPSCGHVYVRWLNFYKLSGQRVIEYKTAAMP